jgi:hypothetical protein
MTTTSQPASLYNIRTDRIENTVSNSFSVIACVYFAAETCFPSRYQATDDLFWLNYSSFEVSCHNILWDISWSYDSHLGLREQYIPLCKEL